MGNNKEEINQAKKRTKYDTKGSCRIPVQHSRCNKALEGFPLFQSISAIIPEGAQLLPEKKTVRLLDTAQLA